MEIGVSREQIERLKGVAGAEGGVPKRASRLAFYIGAGAARRVPGSRAFDRILSRWLPESRDWLHRHHDVYFEAAHAALAQGAEGAMLDTEPDIVGTVRYHRWIAENETGDAAPRAAASRADAEPAIAILLEAQVGEDAAALTQTLASLVAQTDGAWQCLVAGGAFVPEPAAGPAADRRMCFVAPAADRPCAALNALLGTATAPFVAVLDPGDVLAPGAIAVLRKELALCPELDLLYSDEDVLEAGGTRRDPAFKPSWSPELLIAYNYIGRVALLRRALVEQAGGFMPELGRAAEWDLNLRLSGHTDRIGRLTKVLCHRSPATPGGERPTPDDPDSALFREALRRHWEREGCTAAVATQPDGTHRATWALADPPLVSVIIPSKDKPELLGVCRDGLLKATAYPRIEVIVVDNDSTDPATLALYGTLRACQGARIVPFLEPFNAFAACNAGAQAANGDLLLFLNDGIEVTDPDWLTEMVRWATRPGVGVVGTKLVYPDGGLQHAGVVVGLHVCGPVFRGAEPGAWGVFGSPDTPRNYLAITGACQMVRREVFESVGGFDETYRTANGDVALCLRAWKAGHRIVYTPFAQVTHHEGSTRDHPNPPEDLARTAADIRALGIEDDPFFHPGLSSDLDVPTLRLGAGRPTSVQIVRDIDRLLAPYPPPAPLDLHDDAAMRRAIGAAEGTPLPGTSEPERIEDRWSAARFCIARLRADPTLRARFPRALSAGADGDFAAWLRAEGRERFSLTAAAVAALEEVLRNPPRARVFHNDLTEQFPLAFTPAGRRDLLAWLFRNGRTEYGFRPEEIWWFALECAEDPAGELLRTWLMTPAWQRLFPEAITRFGRERFGDWLAAMFGLAEDWAQPDAWPEDLSPAQQLRLAWQTRSAWQRRFPDALDREEGARGFLHWLAEGESGAPESLRAWCRGLDRDATARALCTLGVNVIGHFAYPSGLRTSVESLVEGLRAVGTEVALRNVPGDRRKDDPIHGRFTGLEEFPVTLVHVQPEPFFLQAHELSGLVPRAPRGTRIGYWYWEMDTVPASWDQAARQTDELWAATRFVADALRARFDVPVFTLPPGVELAPFTRRPRARFGIPADKFVFLFVFHMMSIMERKNPLGLIRAFTRAFSSDEPVVLVLKTTFGENHPGLMHELRTAAAQADVEVIVIDEIYSQDETLSLMETCDAYVSLHRSEGLGLTLAEAMLLGKPVVATGFSGNVDFMNASNSLLVDYQVVPIGVSIPPYEAEMRWAAPSEEHAAAFMRLLFDDRAFAAALGARAKEDVGRNLSMEAAGRRMADRLSEIRAARLVQAANRLWIFHADPQTSSWLSAGGNI